MNRFQLFVIIFLLTSTQIIAQQETYRYLYEPKAAVTIGILNGGGSLIGFDFEYLIGQQFGLQVGAGLIGFGAGINYHISPGIRSSFLSLQYLHQGAPGPSHMQTVVGPSFVYRGKRWFTAQIGYGFALEKGPAYPPNREQAPFMLIYSIGFYRPL